MSMEIVVRFMYCTKRTNWKQFITNVEAPSIEITDETLIKGWAKRLVGNVKEKNPISWPPEVSKSEEPDVLNTFLTEFLRSLRMSKISLPEHDPLVLSLASALSSSITKQRTKILINNTVNLHDITRYKELVQNFYKQRFGIRCADILYLRD